MESIGSHGFIGVLATQQFLQAIYRNIDVVNMSVVLMVFPLAVVWEIRGAVCGEN